MKRWYIYALSDPRTGETRYIGKTVKTIQYRLQEHILEAMNHEYQTHKARWIRALISNGLSPEVRMLDSGVGPWGPAEKYWIEFFRNEVGSPLTNLADGGLGPVGVKRPDVVARNHSMRGRILSEDHRRKLSAASPRTDKFAKWRELLTSEERVELAKKAALARWR